MNIPLSYVIGEDLDVPNEADDPLFGNPDSNYLTCNDKMNERASLEGPDFGVDNAQVYELLKQAVSVHKDVYNWIKPQKLMSQQYFDASNTIPICSVPL